MLFNACIVCDTPDRLLHNDNWRLCGYGRVSERVFVMQLPNHRIFTVYSLVGDLFGWLMVAGFVVIVVLAILVKRKGASASASD